MICRVYFNSRILCFGKDCSIAQYARMTLAKECMFSSSKYFFYIFHNSEISGRAACAVILSLLSTIRMYFTNANQFAKRYRTKAMRSQFRNSLNAFEFDGMTTRVTAPQKMFDRCHLKT